MINNLAFSATACYDVLAEGMQGSFCLSIKSRIFGCRLPAPSASVANATKYAALCFGERGLIMLTFSLSVCSRCGREFESRGHGTTCPRCQSQKHRNEEGSELPESLSIGGTRPKLDKVARVKRQKHGNKVILFGNTGIYRRKCKRCGGYAFAVDGEMTCCGAPVTDSPKGYARECEPFQHRKSPAPCDKRRILDEQGNCCFYCGVSFGSIQIRNGKPIRIITHWDHRLPYAYSQNNKTENFVAACHVCNGIKNDKIFQDVDEAMAYLALRRAEKGYNF